MLFAAAYSENGRDLDHLINLNWLAKFADFRQEKLIRCMLLCFIVTLEKRRQYKATVSALGSDY